MNVELTAQQIAFLRESLKYSQRNIEDYHEKAPAHVRDTAQSRVAEVCATCDSIKQAFREAKDNDETN